MEPAASCPKHGVHRTDEEEKKATLADRLGPQHRLVQTVVRPALLLPGSDLLNIFEEMTRVHHMALWRHLQQFDLNTPYCKSIICGSGPAKSSRRPPGVFPVPQRLHRMCTPAFGDFVRHTFHKHSTKEKAKWTDERMVFLFGCYQGEVSTPVPDNAISRSFVNDSLYDRNVAREVCSMLEAENRMYGEQLRKYIRAMGGGPATYSQTRLTNLFQHFGLPTSLPPALPAEGGGVVYDLNSLDVDHWYMDLDSFLDFYTAACRRNAPAVWNDILRSGYYDDLQPLTSEEDSLLRELRKERIAASRRLQQVDQQRAAADADCS